MRRTCVLRDLCSLSSPSYVSHCLRACSVGSDSTALMVKCSSDAGSRLRHLRLNDVRAMNTVRQLVVLLYCFAMAFILSSAILQSGLELVDYKQCFAAIIVCLIFYVGAKVLMYLFLVSEATP